MDLLDNILRYSAFALLGWLAVLMLRDFCDRVAGRLGALSALSSAAYLLATKPGLSAFGVDLDIILLPVYAVAPAITWLFCLSQFDDGFKIRGQHWLVVAVKLTTGGGACLAWKLDDQSAFTAIHTLSNIIVTGIIFHLMLVAWQGRHDDLVEVRRKFRSIFVTAVIIISIGTMMSETALRQLQIASFESLLQAAAFLTIAVFLLWRLSSSNARDLFFEASQPVHADSSAAHCDLTPADRHDLDVITQLGHNVILEPGLTIAKLAYDINVPEHRLRHLINQHLGYRNFSDYMNHHRVEAAKGRLANREDRHTPVLTIAMDLGYGSLGPFNRAFKERTGQTPTEYRNQSLSSEWVAAQ